MKQLIYFIAAIVAVIAMSCSDNHEDIINDGDSYFYKLYLIFEDEDGNNLVTGMSSSENASLVNENAYSLFVTDKYSDRTPVYALSYVTLEGKKYLKFSLIMDRKNSPTIKYEFACKHIFGDGSLHTIEAYFEASDQSEFLLQCDSVVFDGSTYRADSNSRVVIKL